MIHCVPASLWPTAQCTSGADNARLDGRRRLDAAAALLLNTDTAPRRGRGRGRGRGRARHSRSADTSSNLCDAISHVPAPLQCSGMGEARPEIRYGT